MSRPTMPQASPTPTSTTPAPTMAATPQSRCGRSNTELSDPIMPISRPGNRQILDRHRHRGAHRQRGLNDPVGHRRNPEAAHLARPTRLGDLAFPHRQRPKRPVFQRSPQIVPRWRGDRTTHQRVATWRPPAQNLRRGRTRMSSRDLMRSFCGLSRAYRKNGVSYGVGKQPNGMVQAEPSDFLCSQHAGLACATFRRYFQTGNFPVESNIEIIRICCSAPPPHSLTTPQVTNSIRSG
ncbi:hypothetical protein ABIA39_007916 [Nocardia sp. GAS34]